MNVDIESLKARHSLEEMLRNDGHELRRVGVNLKTRCMFHDERTPSFTVFPDNTFKCFGCGAGRDVIDYVRLRDGITFMEAAEKLGGVSVVSTGTVRKKRKPKRAPWIPFAPTQEQKRWADSMALALLFDPELCASIGRDRGWNASTIHKLASEGVLGWNRETRELVFNYPTGSKARRWKHGKGRGFRWAHGKGDSFWRDSFLTPTRTNIVVTEGETDCIDLINIGTENDGRTSVVALPSSSVWHPEWLPLFRDKTVLLLLDNDEAGDQATRKILPAIQSIAPSAVALNWEGVIACLV